MPAAPREENSQPISRLLSLHFSPTIEQEITVTRTTEGGYTAEMVKKELQVHRHRAGGTIDSSLYLAAMQAGIPADVVVDMIRMFSYKVDFQRDLHPGDTFRSLLRLLLHARRPAGEIRRHQLCDDDLGRQADPHVPLPGRSQRAGGIFRPARAKAPRAC